MMVFGKTENEPGGGGETRVTTSSMRLENVMNDEPEEAGKRERIGCVLFAHNL